MNPSVDIWWTLGAAAEPRAATTRTKGLASVPWEWQRGLRGRFLEDVTRRCRHDAHWSAKSSARGWRFNLSAGQHLSLTDSGTVLIIGVGRATPIGIDAERLRPVDEAVATLRRLGLGRIAQLLAPMPAAARNLAFASVWTAFEAYLKLERLPWDIAAARFAAQQEFWRFGPDGSGIFASPAASPVVFSTTRVIPGVLLTVASPGKPVIRVQKWACGRSAIGLDNAPYPTRRELH